MYLSRLPSVDGNTNPFSTKNSGSTVLTPMWYQNLDPSESFSRKESFHTPDLLINWNQRVKGMKSVGLQISNRIIMEEEYNCQQSYNFSQIKKCLSFLLMVALVTTQWKLGGASGHKWNCGETKRAAKPHCRQLHSVPLEILSFLWKQFQRGFRLACATDINF